LKLNINGAPTNLIDIRPASVKIIISCLVLTAPTMVLPNDSLTPPAELVAVGVQSILDSEVENLTSSGSSSVEPIGLQPNAITCLSISDIIICKTFVGGLLAPPIAVASTALVVTPDDSSHT